jgi:hypothetical protein
MTGFQLFGLFLVVSCTIGVFVVAFSALVWELATALPTTRINDDNDGKVGSKGTWLYTESDMPDYLRMGYGATIYDPSVNHGETVVTAMEMSDSADLDWADVTIVDGKSIAHAWQDSGEECTVSIRSIRNAN